MRKFKKSEQNLYDRIQKQWDILTTMVPTKCHLRFHYPYGTFSIAPNKWAFCLTPGHQQSIWQFSQKHNKTIMKALISLLNEIKEK